MAKRRQDVLFAAEDYQVAYEAFTQANLKAYDFDTLKSAMVEYIRLNYPEDFNDWINSSEFVSIIDLVAYMGHSLAFRLDLSSRENFLETATQQDSVLRLAKQLGYAFKRHQNAVGLLKVKSVKTTEPLTDADGISLKGKTVYWNDTTNTNAYDQFISVLNSVFQSTNQYGTPYKKGKINTINTYSYKLNNVTNKDVVHGFSTRLGGIATSSEVCNIDFLDDGYFYEPNPDPFANFHILYRNDGKGNASSDTGFFFLFKQGTLGFKDILVEEAIENRVIDVNVDKINESDVWVQTINSDGSILTNWSKVPNLTGNNVIYNSLNQDVRNIFSVIPRAEDQLSIKFADGRFGNAPKGIIRVWYRTSNAESYIIQPDDIKNVNVVMQYVSGNNNQTYEVTFTCNLEYTVNNASEQESITDIKENAPKVYNSQDRMVTAEDYSVYPLTLSSDIKKIKAVNRMHSGHTRYIDINDPTGTYKDLTIFGDDGYIYREETAKRRTQSFSSNMTSTDIVNSVIEDMIGDPEAINFYFDRYNPNFITVPSYATTTLGTAWTLHPTLTSTDFSKIAYNGSLYVAVGTAGKIYTSADLSVWTSRTSNTSLDITDVSYGLDSTSNDLFVATVINGDILYSSDGIVWYAVNTTPDVQLNRVRYLNSMWWAVGNAGNVIKWDGDISIGNTDWTVVSLGSSSATVSGVDIAWNGTLYLISALGGFNATSTDGADNNWTIQSATGETWQSVITVSTTFWAVGNGGIIKSSSNGTTWITHIPDTKTNAILKDIIYYDSVYIIVGESGTIVTSIDGTTFTEQTSGTTGHLNGATVGNTGTVTTAGNNGIILSSTTVISASAPILEWTQVSSTTKTCTGYFNTKFQGSTNVAPTSSAGIFELIYVKKGSIIEFSESPFSASALTKWATVLSIYGDGRGLTDIDANFTGKTADGYGALTLSRVIPSTARIKRIIPPYNTKFSDTEKTAIIAQLDYKNTFGLYFNHEKGTWAVVDNTNVAGDPDITAWDISTVGGTSNTDKSYLMRIEFDVSGQQWIFQLRTIRYIFASVKNVRFHNQRARLKTSSNTLKPVDDRITFNRELVLNPSIWDGTGTETVNTTAALTENIQFNILDYFTYSDGYTDPRRVILTLADVNGDFVPDNPEGFIDLVGKTTYSSGAIDFNNSPSVYLGKEIDGSVEYTNLANESTYKLNNVTYNSTQVVGRQALKFQWNHYAVEDYAIDPALSNIIDLFILTNSYDTALRNWLVTDGSRATKPLPPTTNTLELQFASLDNYKTSSDTVVYRPVKYRILFGEQADTEFQARFKIIKAVGTVYTDNEIKSKIIEYIEEYFQPEYWDFGESFYYTELSAYIHNKMVGIINSVVIVPGYSESRFGSLFEITPNSDELFISAAKVSDVDIVSVYTDTNLRTVGAASMITSTSIIESGVTYTSGSSGSGYSGSGGSSSSY